MSVLKIQGYEVTVDDEDFESLSQYRWYIKERNVQHHYFRCRLSGGRSLYLHRFIINAPADKKVDHINGDTLDNRKANLRCCDSYGNNRNARLRRDNKLRIKGVRKMRNKFQARIKVDKNTIYLGVYETIQQAETEYINGSLKYHGEFSPYYQQNKMEAPK